MSTAVLAEVKSKTRFYRPELDALRLLAFVMVFFDHLFYGGTRAISALRESFGSGVHIFFILSAYLITELLLRERELTGTVHIRSFYLRRVLRIWPLYFFMIIVGVVFGALVPHYAVAPAGILCLLFFAGNIFFTHHMAQLGVLSPLWSLSVEEQFYLFIPAVMWWGGTRLLVLLSGASFVAAYIALLTQCSQGAYPVWGNSFVNFQFFAAGTLLAVLLRGRSWQLGLLPRAGLLVSSFCALFFASYRFSLPFGTSLPIAPVAAVSHFLLCLLGSLGIFLAFFNVPARFPAPILYLGRITYGLYCFHLFALSCTGELYRYTPLPPGHWSTAFTAIMGLLLSFVLASLSFKFIEQPFNRLKSRFAFVKSGASAS